MSFGSINPKSPFPVLTPVPVRKGGTGMTTYPATNNVLIGQSSFTSGGKGFYKDINPGYLGRSHQSISAVSGSSTVVSNPGLIYYVTGGSGNINLCAINTFSADVQSGALTYINFSGMTPGSTIVVQTSVGGGLATITDPSAVILLTIGVSDWQLLMTSGSGVAGTVLDSSISFSNITTNNATTSKHGFLPQLSGSNVNFLTGNGAYAGITETVLTASFSDITTCNVNELIHGLCPKTPGDVTKFLRGNNNADWVAVPFSSLSGNIAVSQMNSGTSASSSTFWRGDGSWVSSTGSGSVVLATSPTLGAVTATAVTATSLTFNSTSGIIGTVTNNSAAAGSVGEMILSKIESGSEISMTATATWTNITSITLTAGDWDVSLLAANTLGGAGTISAMISNISLFSGTTTTDLDFGNNAGTMIIPTSVYDGGNAIPNYRISVSSNTQVYFKMVAVYTGTAPKGYGRISARRVR